jgi:DNA-directed RNA polymerase subunit RPC12/RpoP
MDRPDTEFHDDDMSLIGYLKTRDVKCPLCGYNLRGLTSPRCPECGKELQLTVGLVEPRQGAWVMGMIALSIAAGFGCLVLVVITQRGWPNTNRGVDPRLFNLSLGYFLLAWILLPLFAMQRRRFLRWSQATQWRWAIILASSTLIAFAVAFYRA